MLSSIPKAEKYICPNQTSLLHVFCNSYLCFAKLFILSIVLLDTFQNIINQVVENLDWCMQNALSTDAAENLGRCLNHATGSFPCVDKFQVHCPILVSLVPMCHDLAWLSEGSVLFYYFNHVLGKGGTCS